MDDWKLKAQAVVKLEMNRDMFVSSHRFYFISGSRVAKYDFKVSLFCCTFVFPVVVTGESHW